jgi:hypothetical protein
MTVSTSSEANPLTPQQWLICGIAAIGFAFDIYELLMLPLILRPALLALIHARPGTPEFNFWVGMMFWIPAMAGGIFGLLGGYLTDRLGRRRVLVWSILIYAVSAFGAGFATSVPMLLFLRCTTFIGVCVEFVAAVAWLAEIFTEPGRREAVIGYTQAFSSIGGVMAAGAYYMIVTMGDHLPAIYGQHESWRYMLMSGVIPALPLIVIRPFLPESPEWERKRRAGTLRRPSLTEIFQPAFRQTTLVATMMVACSYAVAFGAIQMLPQIVPGLDAVRTLARPLQEKQISTVQTWQELGGLGGRILLAALAVRVVGRRRLIRVFQIPGLVIVPLVFLYPAVSSLELLKWGIAIVGVLTVAQFSFWGNYLPRVYPTHLRGTGESFAANVGGRMLGTSAALLTTQLANVMPGAAPAGRLAHAAAVVGFLAFAVGLALSFRLPEPPGEGLPE